MNILVFSFLIFLAQFCLAKNFNIIIDAGHGGQDFGAIRGSFVESKIVLEMAKKIKAQLDLHPHITTTLSRNNKSGLPLKNRVTMANNMNADLFISLHANTASSKEATGMEFYFNSANPKNLNPDLNVNKSPTNLDVINKIKKDFSFYDKTEKSLSLGQILQAHTNSENKKTVVKRANFYVVDHTDMPSILIELGFISNLDEAKKLTSPEYQTELAQLLTKAIIKYKEKDDKSAPLYNK